MKDHFQESMAKNAMLKIQMSDMRAKKVSCSVRLKTLMEAEHVGGQKDSNIDIMADNLKTLELKKIFKKMENKVRWHQRALFLWQIKIIFAVAINAYIMIPLMLLKGAIFGQMLITLAVTLIFIVIGTLPLVFIIGDLLAKLADNLNKSLDNEFHEFLKLHNA